MEPQQQGQHSPLARLTKEVLSVEDRRLFEASRQNPVTILQVGEGNFLRGFVDWMVHRCHRQGLYHGSIAVTQPRASGAHRITALKAQDGLYTVVTRGLRDGQSVDEREIVSIVSDMIDPYAEWSAFLALAESPSLEFVVSNTTEAGIVFRSEPFANDPSAEPLQTFPAKMAIFLYRRYIHFHGDSSKGLVFLPCELIEGNGDRLKACILQHIRDWGLDTSFIDWVENHQSFLNSLVDRIVTGSPEEAQAQAWCSEWGYHDALIDTAEPYHFWAIQSDSSLEQRLPLQTAGLNVKWVDDLTPYQVRKVRILNGAHSLMAAMGILRGVDEVRDAVEHPVLGPIIEEVITREIVPSLPYDQAELGAYAEAVMERFRNPFIRHRLSDIALNSLTKAKVRLLPTIDAYLAMTGRLPDGLTKGFASVLRYTRVQYRSDGGIEEFVGRTRTGSTYVVRDDAQALSLLVELWSANELRGVDLAETVSRILALTKVWERDLNAIPGFTERMIEVLEEDA